MVKQEIVFSKQNRQLIREFFSKRNFCAKRFILKKNLRPSKKIGWDTHSQKQTKFSRTAMFTIFTLGIAASMNIYSTCNPKDMY